MQKYKRELTIEQKQALKNECVQERLYKEVKELVENSKNIARIVAIFELHEGHTFLGEQHIYTITLNEFKVQVHGAILENTTHPLRHKVGFNFYLMNPEKFAKMSERPFVNGKEFPKPNLDILCGNYLPQNKSVEYFIGKPAEHPFKETDVELVDRLAYDAVVIDLSQKVINDIVAFLLYLYNLK
jgi:hypothetical protein